MRIARKNPVLFLLRSTCFACVNPSRSQLGKPLPSVGHVSHMAYRPLHLGRPKKFCGRKRARSGHALLWSSAGGVLEKMENIFHPREPRAHVSCIHSLLTYHLHYCVISARLSSLFKQISSAGCLLRWLWLVGMGVGVVWYWSATLLCVDSAQ